MKEQLKTLIGKTVVVLFTTGTEQENDVVFEISGKLEVGSRMFGDSWRLNVENQTTWFKESRIVSVTGNYIRVR